MADHRRKSFLLRIPQDLWDDLNRWARDDLRSVNAQIEFVLREAVRRRTAVVRDAPREPTAPHLSNGAAASDSPSRDEPASPKSAPPEAPDLAQERSESES